MRSNTICIRARIGIVICLFAWWGCGGSAPMVSGNGGNPAPGGAAEQNRAALREAVARFTAFTGDPSTVNQQMLAYLHSRTDIASAGISDGSVWAQFKNGEYTLFVNNREVMPPNRAAAPKPMTRALFDIPSGRVAHLVDNFGGQASTSQALDLLNTNGYDASQADGSVAGLKKIGGEGVFYIDTHGGYIPESGTNLFFLMANEIVDLNAKGPDPNQDDIRLGRLVLGAAKFRFRDSKTGQIVERTEAHYWFNHLFIDAHWTKFSDGSLVFINACSSVVDGNLIKTLQKKHASVIVGWSQDVFNAFAVQTVPLVFDRLLGSNTIQAEVPNQRPFDYVSVVDDLTQRHLSADSDGATLTFIPSNSSLSFGELAPSLAYMSVDESKNELTLTGQFGTDASAGKVTIGGSQIAVKQWNPTQIICDLPPDLAGDVVVEVRQHKSNTVPLTQWVGQFTYTLQSTMPRITQTTTFILKVQLRADIHAHRDQPHQPPQQATVPLAAEQQSSTCRYQTTGEDDESNHPVVLSGSGDLTLKFGNTAADIQAVVNQDAFVVTGSVDSKQRTADLTVLAFAQQGLIATDIVSGTVVSTPVPLDFSLYASSLPPLLHLTMDDRFNIKDGQLQAPREGFNEKLEWHFQQVQFPPDPNQGEDSRAASHQR